MTAGTTLTAPTPTRAGRRGERRGGSPVRLQGVTKVFGSAAARVPALAGVSLEVGQGEFLCLVGASGCGKSTLLNLVAGLDSATEGTVEVDGRVALLFQEAALFPWLTAAGNVELALRLAGTPRRERRARARDLLDLVRLADVADRRPHELSGGMRQRVAVARALAQDADVLLMDEPFGALDAMTRDVLHDEVERLVAERRPTVVFVTHSVAEAVRLADRVVLLTSRPGRVAEEFAVPFARPRRGEDAESAALVAHITARLREEVARHGQPAAR